MREGEGLEIDIVFEKIFIVQRSRLSLRYYDDNYYYYNWNGVLVSTVQRRLVLRLFYKVIYTNPAESTVNLMFNCSLKLDSVFRLLNFIHCRSQWYVSFAWYRDIVTERRAISRTTTGVVYFQIPRVSYKSILDDLDDFAEITIFEMHLSRLSSAATGQVGGRLACRFHAIHVPKSIKNYHWLLLTINDKFN